MDLNRWPSSIMRAKNSAPQAVGIVGTSRNAVMTQIWIAMIVYLLVSFARYAAQSGWTVQRMLRVLQLNLFERKRLEEILDPDPPIPKDDEPQLRLVA